MRAAVVEPDGLKAGRQNLIQDGVFGKYTANDAPV